MRICFLEGDMSRSGGTERMTAWLANRLSKDHSVSVLSLRLGGDSVFFPLEHGVSHQVLPPYPGKLGIGKQIRWIHRYVKENCIDWVINVDMGMGFYGILAAKGTCARTITWEHGNYYNNWGSRLFPYMRRFAARHSDALVVLTNRDRENYLRNIRRCAPVYVMPNPAEEKENVFDPGSRMILSVGHLLKNKGYHRVVEMAEKLLPGHPGWEWVICGEGPERQSLEAMIREKGLEDRVKLAGLVRDMDEMYRKAAMVVMTSDMEGLPMVLLEGKARSLPLVSFDIMTGPSDIIDDGVNGCLVEPFDVEAMAEKIGKLIDDPLLRRHYSERSILRMDRFREEEIVNKWENLLIKRKCKEKRPL